MLRGNTCRGRCFFVCPLAGVFCAFLLDPVDLRADAGKCSFILDVTNYPKMLSPALKYFFIHAIRPRNARLIPSGFATPTVV